MPGSPGCHRAALRAAWQPAKPGLLRGGDVARTRTKPQINIDKRGEAYMTDVIFRLEARRVSIMQHTYVHMYRHTPTCTQLHSETPPACMQTANQTYLHACMHTCIHAYMHTCIHAYMHTCIHAYLRLRFLSNLSVPVVAVSCAAQGFLPCMVFPVHIHEYTHTCVRA